jgi:hypothetical protein
MMIWFSHVTATLNEVVYVDIWKTFSLLYRTFASQLEENQIKISIIYQLFSNNFGIIPQSA